MKKSEALRKAASQIADNPTSFQWGKTLHCNCGILAQVVLGMTAAEMREYYTNIKNVEESQGCELSTVWSAFEGIAPEDGITECPATGHNISDIFMALYDVGFTRSELFDLEWLANAKFKGSRYTLDYSDPTAVVDYMHRWAMSLEATGH